MPNTPKVKVGLNGQQDLLAQILSGGHKHFLADNFDSKMKQSPVLNPGMNGPLVQVGAANRKPPGTSLAAGPAKIPTRGAEPRPHHSTSSRRSLSNTTVRRDAAILSVSASCRSNRSQKSPPGPATVSSVPSRAPPCSHSVKAPPGTLRTWKTTRRLPPGSGRPANE